MIDPVRRRRRIDAVRAGLHDLAVRALRVALEVNRLDPPADELVCSGDSGFVVVGEHRAMLRAWSGAADYRKAHVEALGKWRDEQFRVRGVRDRDRLYPAMRRAERNEARAMKARRELWEQ